MPEYSVELADFRDSYQRVEKLYREHYAEMSLRLESIGVATSPFNPRLDQYFAASDRGDLKNFILRCDGEDVGYCNIYITRDMHNHDLIAQEDALFVTKSHRNGVGKKFVRFILESLRLMGCKSLQVSAKTDTRTALLWARMGFKETAREMTYTF